MKKNLLFVSFLLFFTNIIKAQTTATDFTATDCGGAVRNLFTELDNGKIVLLVWVEPCVGCISDAKAAYDAAQSFATTYPGKVLFWLSDDVGDTPCSTLFSWAQTNNIPTAHIQVFGNIGNTINESNYGGIAMPHVVVIGNNSHQVYLNILGGANDGVAITAAINQAMTNDIEDIEHSTFSVYPSPTKDIINIKTNNAQLSTLKIELLDMLGRCIKTDIVEMSSSNNSISFPIGNEVTEGNYLLRCSSNKESQTITIIKS